MLVGLGQQRAQIRTRLAGREARKAGHCRGLGQHRRINVGGVGRVLKRSGEERCFHPTPALRIALEQGGAQRPLVHFSGEKQLIDWRVERE